MHRKRRERSVLKVDVIARQNANASCVFLPEFNDGGMVVASADMLLRVAVAVAVLCACALALEPTPQSGTYTVRVSTGRHHASRQRDLWFDVFFPCDRLLSVFGGGGCDGGRLVSVRLI